MKKREPIAPPAKLWNKYFILCWVMQFLYFMAFNMSVPMIAKYVVFLGESVTIAGLVAGFFSVLALCIRPFVSFIVDHNGHKLMTIIAYVFSFIGFFGYALAPNVMAIVAARVVHAVGLCLQTTSFGVVTCEFLPKDRVAEGIGYLGLSAVIAMAIAPATGDILVNIVGYRVTFAGAGVLMAAAIVVLLATPISNVKSEQKGKISINDFISLEFLPLAVTTMAFALCTGTTQSFILLSGEAMGIANVALFFVVSSIGMIAFRPAAGKITDRTGLRYILPVCFVAEAICMAGLAFANSLIAVLGCALARSFGQGTSQSSMQGQILKDAPDEKKGVAMGTFYLGMDVGQGTGAMLGGWIADNAGYSMMYLSCVGWLIVGFVAFLIYQRKQNKNPARSVI